MNPKIIGAAVALTLVLGTAVGAFAFQSGALGSESSPGTLEAGTTDHQGDCTTTATVTATATATETATVTATGTATSTPTVTAGGENDDRENDQGENDQGENDNHDCDNATATTTATTASTTTATPTGTVTATVEPEDTHHGDCTTTATVTATATATSTPTAGPGENDQGENEQRGNANRDCDVKGIPATNPNHQPEATPGVCHKGETVIKTTPSGQQVNVPCQAVDKGPGNHGDGQNPAGAENGGHD